MDVEQSSLAGVVSFVPAARHRDERGWFARTFDTDVAVAAGVHTADFRQDSQSRSHRGVLRGMHGRTGRGEAKLVRCARGAVHDVLVDARPGSPTFGQQAAFLLDDVEGRHLYVPPGMLHGFLVLSDEADVCYRIDRPHDPTEDVSVHWADPDLAIAWPTAPRTVSARDQGAGTWADLRGRLQG